MWKIALIVALALALLGFKFGSLPAFADPFSFSLFEVDTENKYL